LHFVNIPATTQFYTLSLHDALPICALRDIREGVLKFTQCLNAETPCSEFTTALGLRLTVVPLAESASNDGTEFSIFDFRFSGTQDRKSTRLNSSHVKISYAVFCLKK